MQDGMAVVRSRLTLSAARLALVAAAFVSIPATGVAQEMARFSVAPRGGIALPGGDLERFVEPGASMGVDMSYAFSRRAAAHLRAEGDLLRGATLKSGITAPDMKVLHYTAALEAMLLNPVTAPLGVAADLGLGVSTFISDTYNVPNTTATARPQKFHETYPTLRAGLNFSYPLRSSLALFLDTQAYYTFMNPNETRRLTYLTLDRYEPVKRGVTIPLTLGVRTTFGSRLTTASSN